jgi:hypothetical protein
MKDKELSIVEEARKRFQMAEKYYGSSRIQAVEDTKFYWGDSDNGYQWPDEVRKMRQFDKRVCLTVNITAQHVNQITNNIRQNRPACRVMPVDDFADKKTAEIFGGVIRNIQTNSAADDAHDLAAEHAVVGGEGFWRVITEYESPSSFNQVIKIKTCPNPNNVYIDPNAKELDRSDAEWCFIFEDITKETFEREHPDIDPASWVPDKMHWMKEDTFRQAEYFYLTYVKDKALLLENGESILESNLEKQQVTRNGDMLSHISGESIKIIKERATERKQWKWCKLVGNHEKPIEQTDWLGEYMPVVCVVGKELNINGQIERKGLVRDLKDPARMVNYSYSETVQTLALQNKVPYMAASEAIEGFEQIWQSANLENRAYLPFNHVDSEGNPIPTPQRQPPAVMPAAQVSLLQLSTEEMRAASGQQNSNFGIKSEASSGIGIQRLKASGEMATFHFPDNLARALRYEGKVLIDLIQKYYDTKRIVRILGIDGKQESAVLDPEAQQPYNEIDIGEEDVQKIFNPTVGTYDVVIDTGPSYQTQRQESFAALMDLAGRNPAVMRSADFPMADQLAKRLEKTLPPGLQDQKGGAEQRLQQATQQGQQMQQQLEMMTQQMQEMQQALQQAESGQMKTQAEIQAKLEMAELDAHLQQMKLDHDLALKRQQMMMDEQLMREKIELEAHIAMEKAEKEACLKLELAAKDAESKEDIAELNAFVDLEKAKIQPPPALTADVNQDLAEEKPLPKIMRRKISMKAPSGGIYEGTIEDQGE